MRRPWLHSLVVVTLVASGTPCLAADSPADPVPEIPARYYDLREEGWFWYRDPHPPRTDATAKPDPKLESDPRQQIQAQRDALDRAMAQAVLNPTPDNISAYLELNYQTIRQAGRFADAWQHTLWSNPGLDHRLVSPVGAGAYLQADEMGARQEVRLHAASKRYGLLFFFRSSCGYCHRLAPVLKAFVQRYGFEVIAVSLDGGKLPDFPDTQPNVAAAAQLQVNAVPAIYLLNATTRTVVPSVFGYVGFSELAQRIAYALDVAEGSPQLADTGVQP